MTVVSEEPSDSGASTRGVDAESNSRQLHRRSFITRLLLAVVPDQLKYAVQQPLPSSQPSGRLGRIVDAILYTHTFALIWSTALGRTLTPADFPRLPSSLSVKFKLAYPGRPDDFEPKSCQKGSKSSKYTLLRTLIICFQWELLEGLGAGLLYVVITVSQVFLYKAIIDYLLPLYHWRGPGAIEGHGLGEGVGLLFAAAGVICLGGLFKARASFAMDIVGGQVKTFLAAKIASKALETTQWAFHSTHGQTELEKGHKEATKIHPSLSTGGILNLANTDTERVQLGIRLFNDVWPVIVLVPLQGGISFWLIGWPAWAGTGLQISMLLCTVPLLFAMYRVRFNVNIQTDERVKHVQDMISGIRLLKACAWEDVFFASLKAIRRAETILNKTKMQISAFLMLISFYAGAFPALIALALYTINHSVQLNHSAAILCVVFLANWMSEFFFVLSPSIVAVVDAWQSLHRIQNFLQHEELIDEGDQISSNATSLDNDLAESRIALDFVDAQFSWMKQTSEKHESDFFVQPLTLSINQGELFAITGATSSGKTLLAKCLAGSTCLNHGRALRQCQPVYAPNSPWLYSDTIRNNILFGQEFNNTIYWSVIESCHLAVDFGQFPAGDMSLLGEKGLNLSGGQKARVGLARAIYTCLIQSECTCKDEKSSVFGTRGTGIIIMDDPLSALDAATASVVFDKAILKQLSHFTRVLVTHQVQVLGQCDRVAWVESGKVSSCGPFSMLMNTDQAFRSFVGEKLGTNADHDEDEVHTDANISYEYYEKGENIIEEEERETHNISWGVVGSYLRARRYWPFFILIGLVYIASQIGNVMYAFFFAWWTSARFDLTTLQWIFLLGAIMITQSILWLVTVYTVPVPLIDISEDASNTAMEGVLTAPMEFFDSNPSGRIINRFTQDVNATDNNLPTFLWQFIMCLCVASAIIGLSIYYVHLVAAILVPWLTLILIYMSFYKLSPLAIKRIEAPLSSNVISQITDIVTGSSEIQVSDRARSMFMDKLYLSIDELNRIHLSSYAVHGWVSVWATLLSCLFYIAVGLFALRLRHSIAPAIISALLFTSFNLLFVTQILLYRLAEVQRCFNCVERLNHYTHNLGKERQSASDTQKETWPQHGKIEVVNVSVRYRDNGPLALSDLSLTINAGEKIGIVGRTGAGKSTLYSLLLGLLEPCNGSISIDGIKTSDVSLRVLREAIAIIPQEPTLFMGTVRSNIDPRQQYSDEELNHALQTAGLQNRREEISESQAHKLELSTKLSPGGLNLSSGQRQLLSLTRALVRHTRIILIDEATAMVDYNTDARIQNVLRERLQDRTLVAIAHRLTTVLHYDKIATMEGGRIVEFDPPYTLWKKNGIFRQLCDKAKITEAQFLKDEI